MKYIFKLSDSSVANIILSNTKTDQIFNICIFSGNERF